MLSTLHTTFPDQMFWFPVPSPSDLFKVLERALHRFSHQGENQDCVFSQRSLHTNPLSLSTSQWPTGPWIRPTSSEKQRLQEPTRWRRRVWRESRTLLHQPGWSTRLVTMVTVGRTNTLHRFDSLASSPAVTMLETSFLKRDQGLIELNKVSAAHLS